MDNHETIEVNDHEPIAKLDSLLQQLIPLAVTTLEASFRDAEILRSEVMRRLPYARTEAELASLVSTRIEIGAWISQLIELLNAITQGTRKSD